MSLWKHLYLYVYVSALIYSAVYSFLSLCIRYESIHFLKVFPDHLLAVCQSSLYLYKVKLEGCPGITQPLVLSNLCSVMPIPWISGVTHLKDMNSSTSSHCIPLLVKAFQIKSVLLSFFFFLILFIQNCSIQQQQALSPRFV